MSQIKAFWAVLRRFWLRIIWRFIPSSLPTGVPELEKFSTSIIDTYGLPDFPSYRHAIATMIMHLGPTATAIPKFNIYRGIRKSMSNQVAYEVIQKIKEDQEIKAKMDKATELPRAEPVQV